jgi:hypothetical protein
MDEADEHSGRTRSLVGQADEGGEGEDHEHDDQERGGASPQRAPQVAHGQ